MIAESLEIPMADKSRKHVQSRHTRSWIKTHIAPKPLQSRRRNQFSDLMFNNDRKRLEISRSRYPSSIFLFHLRQEVCNLRHISIYLSHKCMKLILLHKVTAGYDVYQVHISSFEGFPVTISFPTVISSERPLCHFERTSPLSFRANVPTVISSERSESRNLSTRIIFAI